MVDTEGFKKIDAAAQRTKNRIDIGEWKEATQYWAYTQGIVLIETCNVDFYNILTKKHCSQLYNLLTKNVQSIDEGAHTVTYSIISHAKYYLRIQLFEYIRNNSCNY
jgi:hypothetical protein